ncbi:histone deacetylase complex protein [Macrolepiota fuliginosa MF-IS2]|uniref:histone deacetylase n=1 Tax=Macrolepiota fuliginosa MF-IS2 TaxID=1400762 RepID=A0A9P5X961_9AGAR|nr:histone deacetylase complex protein [Macrolepiota fuliginosa MF-IS2]
MASTDKPKVAYVVSTELIKVSSLLPSNKKRSLIVHALVKSLGLLEPDYSATRIAQTYTPRRATRQDLGMYHTPGYLDFVLDPVNSEPRDDEGCDAPVSPELEVLKAEYGLEDDCPTFPGLPDYVHLVAGATLTAVDALRYGISDIAINWDGGRHHASKSRASGFCYVADCVLAILALKTIPRSPSSNPQDDLTKPLPRVFYLDLDLHFSDVVSSAFTSFTASGAPRLMTLSIHHTSPGFFPPSPRAQLPDPAAPRFDPFSLSIPLCEGASNKTYATIWSIVEELKDNMQPDYIVVQCGTDGLAGDPCATFNWSLCGGEGSLGWCIERILNQWKGKKLFLGGGGYNSANAARAWAYITSIALGNTLDAETDIPDHPGFPLYAPSFTLDVPGGNMRDQNTTEYLEYIQNRFKEVIPFIRQKLGLD